MATPARLHAVPLALCLLLALLLNFPYLGAGFAGDDLIFLNMFRADPVPYSHWSGLWGADLGSYEIFRTLWWVEIDPDVVARGFFRPVPSLAFEGSLALFGEVAFPLHLLVVLLHGAVGFTVYLLARRLVATPGVPALAALVFLACEDHSMVVGWIAASTDVFCALFVNAALLLHLASRAPGAGATAARVGSIACLLLALGSKESAVIAPLAIVVLELLVPGAAPASTEIPIAPLRARLRQGLHHWRRWAPAVLVLCAYLVCYKLAHFGAGGDLYIDPVSRPLAYLGNAALGLPILLLAAVTPVPPSLALFLPGCRLALAAAGVGIAVFLGLTWRRLAREPGLGALLVLALLALLPQLATVPSERLLYLPMVFGSAVIAGFLSAAPPIARRVQPGPRQPTLCVVAGWLLLLGMLLPGLALSAAFPWIYARSTAQPAREMHSAAEAVAARAPERVVLLNTSGMFLTLYAPDALWYELGRKIPVELLSSTHAVMELQRLDDRSFVLRADRRGWLTNMFAAMVRVERHIPPGRVYRRGAMTAEPVQVTDDRRDALAVRFAFSDSLETGATLLLAWDGERFRVLDWAEWRDDEIRTLADTSDLWKAMLGG